MSKRGNGAPHDFKTIAVTSEERAQYVARQLENAKLFLENARASSKKDRSGHIAAILLYDCFECLVTAAIAHVPSAPIYHPHTPAIHNVRREQFEKLYAHQLPHEHALLSFIIKRRNAVRYIEPTAKLAPWEIADYKRDKIDRAVRNMERYLAHVQDLLSRPYQPLS